MIKKIIGLTFTGN